MKSIWSLFLMYAILTVPLVSSAAELNSVVIRNTEVSRPGGALQVAFSLENLTSAQQKMTYGIRLQSISGPDVYEVPIDSLVLEPREEVIRYATMTVPPTARGAYDIFLLSRDEGGLVSILKYVGVVDSLGTSTSLENASLAECALQENTIKCAVIGMADFLVTDINFAIRKGSMYGSLITEGVVSGVVVEGESITMPVAAALPGGYVTYQLWLKDKVLAQSVVVHTDAPETVAQSSASNTELAFVQERHLPEGSMRYIVLLVPALLLIALLYFALRRPRVGVVLLAISGLSVAGAAFAAVTLTDTQPLAHIFNGFSKDSGAQQFSITLDKTEFQTVESVGMSVVFQNTALPNAKPTGGSIDINVDGGAWQPLVTAAEAGTIYHKTIAAIASAGVHTLNFRSPDLCGGAFGFSLFNTGIFGTTECLFSMPVTVVQNEPPSTPGIGGNCILGESCNIGIVSADSDGGQLCYETQWPDGLQQSVGCAASGVPVSASYTFNSCSTSGTTVRAQATDSRSLQSAWGAGASNIANTITCTEPCTHCTYNGIVGEAGISAVPAFIPPSQQVAISWNLTNVATCSVVGNNVQTGALVDSWGWDAVRLNSSKQSSVLTGATKYVLSCTDFDGNAKTAFTIVSDIPDWEEF